MRAFITGLAGPALTDEERGFLREAQPWGFILFKRNVTDAAALRRLIDDARAAVAREAPGLIDPEGGRVPRRGRRRYGGPGGASASTGLARRFGRPIRLVPPTARYSSATAIPALRRRGSGGGWSLPTPRRPG